MRWDAIVPTQSRHDHPAVGGRVQGRLLGPDGRYEHRPLRLVDVDDADLQILAATAQALGQALATAPHGELAEALAAGAEAAAPTYGPAPTPVGLVELIARVHGVLDLADTDDTDVLRSRLTAAAGSDAPEVIVVDVVLRAGEEAAYQRTVDRFNSMWASGSGLDRFLY
jgi:hypothetical protein